MKKRIICMVMAFLLCLGLTGLFLAADTALGYLGKNAVVKAVNESGYASEAYKAFSEKYKEVLTANHINMKATGEAFSEDRFCSDFTSSVSMTLVGGTSSIDTRSQEEELVYNIKAYLTTKGVDTSGAATEIDRIAGDAAAYYKSFCEFSFGEGYYEAQGRALGFIVKCLPVVLGLVVASLIVITSITVRRHRQRRYISYGLIGSAIADTLIYMWMDTDKVMMPEAGPEYYKEFIGVLAEGMLEPYLITVGALLIIAAGLILRNNRSDRDV